MTKQRFTYLALILLALGAATGLSAQTVNLAASTSPSAGQAGITNVSVTGSNFPSGTILPANVTVRLTPVGGGSPTATTATTVVTVIGTTRRVTFLIPSAISVSIPASYLVSISGTAGTVSFASSNSSALTVNPPSSLASLTPASGAAGQTVTVSITGQFTNFLQGSTQANFGAGISVNGGSEGGYGPLAVTSATSATATIVIDAVAAGGPRNITVATGIQQASLAGGFAVTVPNHPPVANAGGPYNGNVGAAIAFNAGASSDPDGDPLTLIWTFGDGGTATGATPSHTYLTFGSFTASVTANDGKGGTNTATATVTVNSIPVANAGGPYAGTVGQSISFSGAGATDADGDSLNYSWDFGDGSQGTGVNATHAYSVSGSFTVSLTVDDGHGAINTAMAVATIASAGTVPIPSLSITAPSPLALFNQNTITVTGTVDSTATSVTVNGVAATIAGGSFTANNVPLREGNNLLTATALNAAGGAGTSTVSVTLDTTPPTVTIDSPSDSALLGSSQITVSGMVNDLVSGTVNGGDVTVTVNGVTASVSNRSFVVNNLLLVPGVNSITAIATDRAGNHSQTQVQVTLQSVVNQQRIVLISGNNQAGVVGSVLQQPLSVQLVDANGGPISSRAVTFSVAKNNGVLLAPPAVGRQITLPTDSNGFASVQLQVGTRVGAGNNVVAVTSIGFVGEVTFSESSLVGGQAQINAYSGDGQRGAAGQPLPEPLVVLVTDSGGNPVAGAPVTFTVSSGAGTIAGAPTATPLTDGNGRAAVIFTLSNEEGISNNQVAATVQGLTGFAATFSASGLVPGDAASTTVSGIILDNTDTAIANATATIVGTNLSALSDAQGNFTIANAPVGKIVLLIDGRSSSRPETFPTLSFDLVTLAGQDNTVGGPIYLPPLDTVNSQIVGGDQDVVLQMDGVPGYSFTVFAHSVTFADGSHVGRVSLSQVHSDKVPMAPPNGTGPRIAGTLQPAGVHFNPPIRVQFPNTDGLAPGTVLDVYSFDHDMNTWASQGPARVSPDGSVIVSDRGFGIAKSGWHFAPPPPPPNTCTGDQECRKCVDGGQCENSPRCTPCSIGACDGQGSCRKGRDWLSDAGVCSTVTVNYNFLRTDTAATAWAKSHNGAPAPADLCGGVSVYQVLSVSANCNGTALDLSGATLQEHLQVISDSCPFGSPRSGNACKVGPGGSVTGQNAPYCLDTMGGAAPYSAVKSKMGTAPSCTQVVQQTFNVDSCLANTFHILTNTMTNTGSTCSASTTLQ